MNPLSSPENEFLEEILSTINEVDEEKDEKEEIKTTETQTDYTEKIDKVNDSLDILIFTTSLLCGLILSLLFGWGFNSNAK